MRQPIPRSPRHEALRMGPTLVGVLALVLTLVPASALAQESEEDRFTCQATLLRIEDNAVLGTRAIGEANPDGDPCAADDGSVIGEVELGPVTADLLYARTADETDDGARQGRAESGVANVVIDLGGNEIQVEVLTSEAQAGPCPSTELSSDSTVVGLRINDQQIEVPAEHTHIDLGPLGTLHLNHEETEEGDGEAKVTRRALFFEDETGAVGNIIIAEAIADVHGDPCRDGNGDRLAGWFTGGGFVAEPGSNRDRNEEGQVEPGTVVHHAVSLDCFEQEGTDPRPGKDNLVAQWFDEDRNEHASFKLQELHDTRCYFDPEQGDAGPPRSEFNTIEGSGEGVCRFMGQDFPAQIRFRFTDEGEPGIDNDEADIEVTSPHPAAPVFCNYTAEGRLDGGNHQAHQMPAQRSGGGDADRGKRGSPRL